MVGPAVPDVKAVPNEYEPGRTYVIPWDVPDPDPTDPPILKILPLTTRFAEI
jgi:hypothetical protein